MGWCRLAPKNCYIDIAAPGLLGSQPFILQKGGAQVEPPYPVFSPHRDYISERSNKCAAPKLRGRRFSLSIGMVESSADSHCPLQSSACEMQQPLFDIYILHKGGGTHTPCVVALCQNR